VAVDARHHQQFLAAIESMSPVQLWALQVVIAAERRLRLQHPDERGSRMHPAYVWAAENVGSPP
jgi:hypothetical protein